MGNARGRSPFAAFFGRAPQAAITTILESVTDAVFILDTAWRFVYLNARAATLLQRPAAALLGQCLWDAFPEAVGTVFEAQYRRARETGVATTFEAHYAPLGVWVDVHAYPSALGLVVYCQDITGRRAAEAALRRQALIFATVSDAIIITDLADRIVDWNPAAERLFGYARAEVLGQTPALLHRPHEAATLSGQVLAAVAQQGCWEGEITFVRKDGWRGVCHTVTVPLLDEAGVRIGTIGVNRDISERQAAEAALRASEARFRALVQGANDAVAILAPDGTIQYESPAAERILGRPPADRIGANALALVHPDDLLAVQAALAAVLAAPGASATVELRTRRPDDSWAWVEATGTNLLAEPAVAGIVANYHDITAQKAAATALRRSEAMLAEAERLAQLGSWAYDVARDELRWSDEIFRIAGYAPQAFVPTPARLLALVHPEDRERVAHAQRAAIEAGAPYDLDHRIVRPDGAVRLIHQQAELVYDAAGRLVGRRGIVQDVTERRALEARLQHQALHDPLTDLPNRALPRPPGARVCSRTAGSHDLRGPAARPRPLQDRQ
jgi:PAS domain S-box-containing protein